LETKGNAGWKLRNPGKKKNTLTIAQKKKVYQATPSWGERRSFELVTAQRKGMGVASPNVVGKRTGLPSPKGSHAPKGEETMKVLEEGSEKRGK